MREEDGVASGDEPEDDGAAWEGWDVESDSSDESSDGWIEVDSDSDEDLEISDSEDEDGKATGKAKAKGKAKANDGDGLEGNDESAKQEETVEEAAKRISTLATTKVRDWR